MSIIQNKTIVDKVKLLFNKIIDQLSFNEEIYKITADLNKTLEEPFFKLEQKSFSHPGGFKREFCRRRLTIAEVYLIIVKNHEPEHCEDRLEALKIMMVQSQHAKAIAMPLNTARVQISLMKDAVKSYGNLRIQMEKIHDFSRASFGQKSVIRNFLNELSLIELPEDGKKLKEMDFGWDDHVHDSLSEGRKTATHVLLGAFVKGISKLTLVYQSIDELRVIHEAKCAGKILGITVDIGIEFSVGKGGERRHYMYVPPSCDDSDDFFKFINENADSLKELKKSLEENEKFRQKTIISIIKQFNEIFLPRLNEGFTNESPCWFKPLTSDELLKIVASGQPSREHLRELLFYRFKRIFYKRVLYYRTQLVDAKDRVRKGIFSNWEFCSIEAKYIETRDFFKKLNRDDLANQYLAQRSVVDYDSAIETEPDMLIKLSKLPGEIVLLHPLELGLNKAICHVINWIDYISNVETMNLRDTSTRNPSDVIVFNKFIFFLNNTSIDEMSGFLEQQGINNISLDAIKRAKGKVQKRPILPNCGSDSTGRNKSIPGMGFIKTSVLTPAVKRKYIEEHVILPKPISDLILNKGMYLGDDEHEKDTSLIACMGREEPLEDNDIGDDQPIKFVGFRCLWRYLNNSLKNFIKISVGFAVALYWMYIIQFDGDLATGVMYASLWFFITFFRNVIVDIVAASGSNFKNWSFSNVNFENAFDSVFWTGFSVPVLGMVKNKFDVLWPFLQSGEVFEGAKFFFICFANGIYISCHNMLRNFDKKTIRGNFFRSILSWPFATIFAPLGNMLTIPSIVQAKFWSDVVAAMIEGSGKFMQRFTLRKRDLTEIFPKLSSENVDEKIAAMLDILYIWVRAPRGKTCLRQLLLCQPSLSERIWKKKDDNEVFETKQRIFKEYFAKLLELYSSSGMLNAMTNYALTNYEGREAAELSSLIGSESGNFLSWLKKIEKEFPIVPKE